MALSYSNSDQSKVGLQAWLLVIIMLRFTAAIRLSFVLHFYFM